ncbi:hypothetical protein B0H14DRAFT_2630031 [Mycena olivaceomarginata]|nr:hypothetical protein B0H14DRAFT_2630031 [Mycena olivaceomarginata]
MGTAESVHNSIRAAALLLGHTSNGELLLVRVLHAGFSTPSPSALFLFCINVLVATEKTNMNAPGPEAVGAVREAVGINAPGNMLSVAPMHPVVPLSCAEGALPAGFHAVIASTPVHIYWMASDG